MTRAQLNVTHIMEHCPQGYGRTEILPITAEFVKYAEEEMEADASVAREFRRGWKTLERWDDAKPLNRKLCGEVLKSIRTASELRGRLLIRFGPPPLHNASRNPPPPPIRR